MNILLSLRLPLVLSVLLASTACSAGVSALSTDRPATDTLASTRQDDRSISMTIVNGVAYHVFPRLADPWESKAHNGYAPQQTLLQGVAFKPTTLHNLMLRQTQTKPKGRMHPNGIISSDDSGGQAGWYFHQNEQAGADGSAWATMTAYLTGSVKSIPTTGDNTNILYAPTMKGPNNGCVEFGVEYLYNGAFHTYFYGVDWCNNGNGVSWEVTQSFINTYVAVFQNGDGHPDIQAEAKLEGDGLYHLLVYNNTTHVYDNFGQSTSGTPSPGYSFGGEGWSMWESHYFNVGQNCPQTPLTATAGIRFRNTAGSWSYPYPDTGQIEINNGATGADRDCFYAPYAIEIEPRTPDLGWFSTYVT